MFLNVLSKLPAFGEIPIERKKTFKTPFLGAQINTFLIFSTALCSQ